MQAQANIAVPKDNRTTNAVHRNASVDLGSDYPATHPLPPDAQAQFDCMVRKFRFRE